MTAPTGGTGEALPRCGYWPNIEPRFGRGQLVEDQWYDGRLGRVLGWDDEDHCWVQWRTRADPSRVQIECVAAEDLIARYPVNPLQAADVDPLQAPNTDRTRTR